MLRDRQLLCRGCGKTFIFTVTEQQYFQDKELRNEPKNCPNCRLILRNWRRVQSGEPAQPISEINCAQCGALTKVPFVIKGHRPVYCTTCVAALRRRPTQAQPPSINDADIKVSASTSVGSESDDSLCS